MLLLLSYIFVYDLIYFVTMNYSSQLYLERQILWEPLTIFQVLRSDVREQRRRTALAIFTIAPKRLMGDVFLVMTVESYEYFSDLRFMFSESYYFNY